jgi:hypothetical protein
MTIAAPSVCMQCHSAIKTDSPAIQKLAQYAAENKPVPWVRIYEIPAYVDFSHRAHLAAKNTCEDCHGKVAERDALYREVNLNMGTCMDCHAGKRPARTAISVTTRGDNCEAARRVLADVSLV